MAGHELKVAGKVIRSGSDLDKLTETLGEPIENREVHESGEEEPLKESLYKFEGFDILVIFRDDEILNFKTERS